MFKVVVDHGHLADHLTGWRHKTPSESMKGALWHFPILAAGYPAFVFKQGCFALLALSLARDRRGGVLPLRPLTRRYRLLGVAPVRTWGAGPLVGRLTSMEVQRRLAGPTKCGTGFLQAGAICVV